MYPTDVQTSVVYTTVTSHTVEPGAAQPSSSTSSLYSAVDVSASLTTTVTSIHPTRIPRPRRAPSSTTTTTVFALPASTDASAYLHHVFPSSAAQPTWATGSFYTQLASALYAVDRSFAGRADYATILAAISRAGDADSPQVSASIASSAWGWAAVTTNGWYQSDVPPPVQSDVSQYVGAWRDAEFSVLGDAQKAEATATGKGGSGSGSGGGKGSGGGSVSSSEGYPNTGRDGMRMMAGVVAGLLVGVIGLL
ncbi:uncharacterized protein PG986_000085 [Apiospora aurea]|uniref:Uncharacterized protein n=1 Tax=Apiospora aurea TaxID=335848 RepID=A0ABR1QTN7_9PEZI